VKKGGFFESLESNKPELQNIKPSVCISNFHDNNVSLLDSSSGSIDSNSITTQKGLKHDKYKDKFFKDTGDFQENSANSSIGLNSIINISSSCVLKDSICFRSHQFLNYTSNQKKIHKVIFQINAYFKFFDYDLNLNLFYIINRMNEKRSCKYVKAIYKTIYKRFVENLLTIFSCRDSVINTSCDLNIIYDKFNEFKDWANKNYKPENI
ncbi:hypothetical protein H312_02874, partial [Anncaliia algerae PRA339]